MPGFYRPAREVSRPQTPSIRYIGGIAPDRARSALDLGTPRAVDLSETPPLRGRNRPVEEAIFDLADKIDKLGMPVVVAVLFWILYKFQTKAWEVAEKMTTIVAENTAATKGAVKGHTENTNALRQLTYEIAQGTVRPAESQAGGAEP